MAALVSAGFIGFEHRRDFPLRAREWITVEEQLRLRDRRGALLVDDCPAHLTQLNRVADSIGSRDIPALVIVATAERAGWLPRVKSSAFFRHGVVAQLSELPDQEINEFLNLLDRNQEIRSLVSPQFVRLPRNAQFKRLRQRCRADMIVSLKNVFGFEALDTILLREYAGLEESLQETYRYVCALEAIGTRIHRQLILRLLNMESTAIQSTLELLEGLGDEYDINPSEGIYGWSTRHPVIAETITKYNFSDAEEHERLLGLVVSELNPSVGLELRTLRELCNAEYGVERLPTDEAKLDVYQRMIDVAPAERIPRHRLIRTLLHMNDLEGVDEALRDAAANVSPDPPLARYKVRLAVRRAELTPGILEEDRIAMLKEAFRIAQENAKRFPGDMHAYITIADVAATIAERLKNPAPLNEALEQLEEASETLLDPALTKALDDYRARARRIEAAARRAAAPPSSPSPQAHDRSV